MKGYLNDNSLTQKKIRNNYFLTGDLAFKDSENFYYITKRKDKIIKRFGFKINLNHIENQIKNIKCVKYAKMFFHSSNELILLIQALKKPKNIIREQVEFTFSKKFTTYEYPDKIIITYKNLNKFNKKISLEDIYNKFQNE
jgi:acyl-CoA synthetase (AMP-forming)/AMP-acid ligase II